MKERKRRPRNCANSWPRNLRSGNCPTRLCSPRKFRARRWENSGRWHCASSSSIGSGRAESCGDLVAQASEATEKVPHSFCHSERSEESLFLFMELNRREIPRFAWNDKINYFFRSLFSLWGVSLYKDQNPQAEACAT